MRGHFSHLSTTSPQRSWFDHQSDARLDAIAQMAATRRELIETLWTRVLKKTAPTLKWPWTTLPNLASDITPQEWLSEEEACLRQAESYFCVSVMDQEPLRIQAQDIYWRLGTQHAQRLLQTPTGRRGSQWLQSAPAHSRVGTTLHTTIQRIITVWDQWAVLQDALRSGASQERFAPRAPADLTLRWILQALEAQAPTRWSLTARLWTPLWIAPQGAEVHWREAESATTAADSEGFTWVFHFWQHWIRGALHGLHPRIEWVTSVDSSYRSRLTLSQ